MRVNQQVVDRLKDEVRAGLQEALERDASRKDMRTVLAARRQERLIENYHQLARVESDFMRLVTVPVDWHNLQPQMHWVETDHERCLWDYARNVVSSMPENRVIGRQMRYYFIDANTGRWLGIVCLASALTIISPRHQRLGWDGKTRYANLGKVLNIAVCVPIQPFGTLCGGKLLFVSSLSNEVRTRYLAEYGDELLAMETTSLYGKSSQYNRVKEFEYLGLTKGDGNVHVPDVLWGKINQLLFLLPEYDTAGASSVKLRRINDVSRAVGISGTASTHGHRRGYYWGVTASNSEDLLRGNSNGQEPDYYDRPLASLAAFWHKRWYMMRLPKKIDEAQAFDPSIYKLDNNVPEEHRDARQLTLLM